MSPVSSPPMEISFVLFVRIAGEWEAGARLGDLNQQIMCRLYSNCVCVCRLYSTLKAANRPQPPGPQGDASTSLLFVQFWDHNFHILVQLLYGISMQCHRCTLNFDDNRVELDIG
jgi:hypothetical protein